MYPWTRDELRTLVEQPEGVCVSIYLPIYRAGADSQQNPIRFKNLLRRAEEHLLAGGLKTPELSELLEPAKKLITNRPFWQGQSRGLAVFLRPGVFRCYTLLVDVEEMVDVGNRFHVKPMLRLLTLDEHFYVLALSQREVRLVYCTPHTAGEVPLESVPGSLDEALGVEESERRIQFHTPNPSAGGQARAAVFHGHSPGDRFKSEIFRFFRQVDAGLQDILRYNEPAPLVIAAVDYLFPIYREANTYPYLMDTSVEGNPEGLRAGDLREKAWPIMEPYFRRAQEEAAARYSALLGTGLASSDLGEVVRAAYNGRVHTLFVPVGRERWGVFYPASNEVYVHEEREFGDHDLLDFAALHTFINRGTVYAVQQTDEVPGRALLAALFRY